MLEKYILSAGTNVTKTNEILRFLFCSKTNIIIQEFLSSMKYNEEDKYYPENLGQDR